MWERFVTRALVKLYDMGERNGGRPACEGTKTPCPTLEKIKRVKSAHVAVKWVPMLMRRRPMLDLGDKRGVSLKDMKVFGCPRIQSSV